MIACMGEMTAAMWKYWVGLDLVKETSSSQARVSAHGFRDPDKPAWAEHFLELASLIITELSLFG